MSGVSIVILNTSQSQNLDFILSNFFETKTPFPAELLILEQGNPALTKKILGKHVAKGFIRHLKGRQDASLSLQHVDHPTDLLTEEVFSRVKYPYLFFWSSTKGFSQDIIPRAFKALRDSGKSTIGISGPDSLQPTAIHSFFCHKNDFTSLNDFKRRCKQELEDSTGKSIVDKRPDTVPEVLNVLLVSHASMTSNSGYHVQYYAHMLSRQGASVFVAVPRIDKSEKYIYNSFQIATYKEIRTKGLNFPDGRYPDIVHAWTPREKVRKFCQNLSKKYSFKTIIHLEDNEEYLTENAIGQSFKDLSAMQVQELDQIIPQDRFHPVRGRHFLKEAQGMTMIINTLQRFNTNALSSMTLPAPVDERLFYPRPINYDLRKILHIPEDHVVLAYIGNIRQLKKQEALALYRAVSILNMQGTPATLIRSGNDYISLEDDEPGCKNFEKSLGWVEREEVPEILAAADILIQPGWPGPFDDQRVPSKLPEYFAMGRPVILPRANLGLFVEHGKEGYVLQRADAEGIVRAVQEINNDHCLPSRLAMGAVSFFRAKLQKHRLTQQLFRFYLNILAN